MAKISELPLIDEPTGDETVVVLADAETKRIALAPLVAAAAVPVLSDAAESATAAAGSKVAAAASAIEAATAAAGAAGAVNSGLAASNGINLFRDALFRSLFDAQPAGGMSLGDEDRMRVSANATALTWSTTASPLGNPALVQGAGSGAAFILAYVYAAELALRPASTVTVSAGFIGEAGTSYAMQVNFWNAAHDSASGATSEPLAGTGAYGEHSVSVVVPSSWSTIEIKFYKTSGSGAQTLCGIALCRGSAVRPITEDVGSRFRTQRAYLLATALAPLGALFRPKDNRFDKSTATAGYYISSGSGQPAVNAGYYMSDWIDVSDLADGAAITRTHAYQMAWYSAKSTTAYLAGVATSTGASETVNKPAGAKWARLSVTAANLANLSFEAGASAAAGRAYQLVLASAATAVSANSLADASITPAKLSFFVPAKNKHNPADAGVALGRYILHTSGGPQVSAAYNATGYIPLVPGRWYTVSYANQRAFYSTANTAGFVSGEAPTGSGTTFQCPAGCYFGRFSVATASWDDFQIEEGRVATPFEPFALVIDPQRLPKDGQVLDVTLTRKTYALVGSVAPGTQQTNLYYANLCRGPITDKAIHAIASNGQQLEECWRIEPGNTAKAGYSIAVGSFTLTIAVYGSGMTWLKSADTSVTLVPIGAGTTQARILAIGDSITATGTYALSAAQRLANVKLQGTRHYGSNVTAPDDAALNREGRPGWTLAEYFADGITATGNVSAAAGKVSPFVFPDGIAGAAYRGNTMFWKKAIDIASYAADRNDMIGFEKIARGWADAGPFLYDANGYPTEPTTGWIVYDPAKAGGSKFQEWDGDAWVASASQPDTWSFDLSKYKARFPEAFSEGDPTHLTLMLGSNDFQSTTPTAARLAAHKVRVDALIAAAQAAWPGVRIALLTPPLGAGQDGWGRSLGSGLSAARFREHMKILARWLIDTYDTTAQEASGVFVLHTQAAIDPVNGYDRESAEPASKYATVTVTRFNNGSWVHPNVAVGHPQMGDLIAAWVEATR